MDSDVAVKRIISKKFKLCKKVREVYRHRQLNFFPDNFRADAKTFILSKNVLKHFNSILLYQDFNYIICSISNRDSDLEKMLRKSNDNIIWIKEEFISEICYTDDIYEEQDVQECRVLSDVKRYVEQIFPHSVFKILTLSNLYHHTAQTPIKDIIFSIQNSRFISGMINQLPDSELLEILVEKSNKEMIYEPYYTNLDYLHRTGVVSKGTLMISSVNSDEGEVVEKDRRVVVRGKNINRAMHGDEVFIENDRVVGIFKQKSRVVAGTLIRIEKTDDFYFTAVVRSIDRRYRDIKILTHLDHGYLNMKVLVCILGWECTDELPKGIIIKTISQSFNYEDEIKAIYEHYKIDYHNKDWIDTFSKYTQLPSSLMNNKRKAGNTPESLGLDPDFFSVKRAENDISLGKRVDFRHLDVCSIDPVGCTDIDDALHCTKHENFIEVGVHIADVSFYVTPGSILDLEAKNRSTTVYFPDRRIDMLPPFLSSNLCSLMENVDRAAFSCVWKFDFDYNVIDVKITKSLIHSKAAFSYEAAYDTIRFGSVDPTRAKLKPSLELLLDIATKLRKDRFENGALELNSQELSFDKNMNIKTKEPIPTHYLVEEFMLLANISVAKFIYKFNPEYSLLRKHPLPSAIEIDCIDATNSKTLNESLSKLDQNKKSIVKRIVTRSMQQALYFSSGDSSDFYHYGLATPIYTHFTSPIRRYPDIIVHRTLNYILEGKELEIDNLKDAVDQRSCSLMNFRHRNAQNANRMADDLTLMLVLKEIETFASVIGIRDTGVIVFIEEYGIEGFVPVDKKYNLFDKIKVKVDGDFNAFCINRQFKIVALP